MKDSTELSAFLGSGGGLLPPTPPNPSYQPATGSSDAGSSSNSTTFAYLPSGSPQLPFAFTPSPHSLPTLAGQVLHCVVPNQPPLLCHAALPSPLVSPQHLPRLLYMVACIVMSCSTACMCRQLC